jgi:hypothetical protein
MEENVHSADYEKKSSSEPIQVQWKPRSRPTHSGSDNHDKCDYPDAITQALDIASTGVYLRQV